MPGGATGSSRALLVATLDTALGPLHCHVELAAGAAALVGVFFAGHRPAPPRWTAAAVAPAVEHGPAPAALLAELDAQLRAYLAAERTSFDLPLALRGTAFQQAVWQALLAIPHGHTVTYGALAGAVGRPRSIRAVAAANARNPLSIVVPCHRVVGAAGALTGYAGGLERKAALLALERDRLPLERGRRPGPGRDRR